jgi:hypothetical protein
MYVVSSRNVKDERGAWTKVPYYSIDEKLPYGHGEKSVFVISSFMQLSVEESFAIRWHMGGFDASRNEFAVGNAFNKFPLAVLLHVADLEASYLDENNS